MMAATNPIHGDPVIAVAATMTNANVTLLSTAITFGRSSATAKPTYANPTRAQRVVGRAAGQR